MRRAFLSLFLVVSAAIAAAPGPNPGTGGIVAPAAGPTRSLTGVLAERTFAINCNCFRWVIDKNGHISEVDVAAVVPKLNNFRGQRVRATGNWTTYIRNGKRVPYLIVTQLDPA
jgi:hypothetical protein